MAEQGKVVPREHVARLRLERQGLLGGGDCGDAEAVMVRLGQVQVDPMNVVARSAHIVLFSRCPAYRQADMDALYSEGPRVFEYWTRVAALLSMELYPLIAPVMKRRRSDSYWDRWVTGFLRDQGSVAKSVLSEVETRGPLASRDFPTDKNTGGRWGSRKTAKDALEALWHVGELMVRERRRGEKVFDLTSRVLRGKAEPQDIPEEERLGALWRSAAGSLGACTQGELARAFGAAGWPPDRKLSPEVIVDMAPRAGLSTFRMRGSEAEWVCLAEDLDGLHAKPSTVARRTTLLSPFDNVLNDRGVLRELFGFDYRFEAYTPQAKRQYGAYVLPIVRGTKFIGRLDPKLDRKQKTLIINGLWLEPEVRPSQALVKSLAGTLRSFAGFVGAEKVSVERTEPASLREDLRKGLG